jgi:hypothetical protein
MGTPFRQNRRGADAATSVSPYALTRPGQAAKPATVAVGTLLPVAGGTAPVAARGTVVMVSPVPPPGG